MVYKTYLCLCVCVYVGVICHITQAKSSCRAFIHKEMAGVGVCGSRAYEHPGILFYKQTVLAKGSGSLESFKWQTLGHVEVHAIYM